MLSNDAVGLFYALGTLRQLCDNYSILPVLEILDYPTVLRRIGHFDFRQLYPKFELLIGYIKEMAKYKINMLLIEYDDKFPYEKFEFLRYSNYFSKEQILEIQATAKDNFIEIIPIQQSIGHLEYLLKHDCFRHLRELPEALGELCVTNDESFEVIKDLIDEMLLLHNDCKYIHLGCDEVWAICVKSEKAQYDIVRDRQEAFICFINRLVDYVCSKGKTPILWADMMQEIYKSIDKRAILMVWWYDENLYGTYSEIVKKFKSAGIEVFGATSVWCHDKNNRQNYPNLHNRINNIKQWFDFIREYDINTFVFTNWATDFRMGSPYGIYETSLYILYFAAEKAWNENACDDTYIYRFLKNYHGLENEITEKVLVRPVISDYFMQTINLIDHIKKNKEIVLLISLMTQLDACNSIFGHIFRLKAFRDEVGELDSAVFRTEKALKSVEQLKPDIEKLLMHFMDDYMVNIYMTSRLYFWDEYVFNANDIRK